MSDRPFAVLHLREDQSRLHQPRWGNGEGLRSLSPDTNGLLLRLDGWLSRPGLLYFLALPLLLLRVLLPEDAPLMYENGGYPYLIYLFFLLWGFVIVSDEGLEDSLGQLRWVSLSVGLVLTVGHTIVYNQLANPDVMSPGLVLAGMTRYFGGWISVLGIFGMGIQYLTTRTPWLDYANESVLPFYILHQTVILVVGFIVLQWATPELLEWALIVLVSRGTDGGEKRNGTG